mmetsp:Transcript_8724/g.22780  ORF Transcript_8724/g.22780 Transcript_8724/m.22780 type:complete len:327 (+) Transcript_8724:26-1006(+)
MHAVCALAQLSINHTACCTCLKCTNYSFVPICMMDMVMREMVRTQAGSTAVVAGATARVGHRATGKACAASGAERLRHIGTYPWPCSSHQAAVGPASDFGGGGGDAPSEACDTKVLIRLTEVPTTLEVVRTRSAPEVIAVEPPDTTPFSTSANTCEAVRCNRLTPLPSWAATSSLGETALSAASLSAAVLTSAPSAAPPISSAQADIAADISSSSFSSSLTSLTASFIATTEPLPWFECRFARSFSRFAARTSELARASWAPSSVLNLLRSDRRQSVNSWFSEMVSRECSLCSLSLRPIIESSKLPETLGILCLMTSLNSLTLRTP